MTQDKEHQISENAHQAVNTQTLHSGSNADLDFTETPLDVHDVQKKDNIRDVSTSAASVVCQSYDKESHANVAPADFKAPALKKFQKSKDVEEYKRLQEQLRKLTEELEKRKQTERALQRQSHQLDVESLDMDSQINDARQSLPINTGAILVYVPGRADRWREELNGFAGFAQVGNQGAQLIMILLQILGFVVCFWWYNT